MAITCLCPRRHVLVCAPRCERVVAPTGNGHRRDGAQPLPYSGAEPAGAGSGRDARNAARTEVNGQ